MLQQQLDSNVGMKDLQTCGRQKDNIYTLGQLSRQPLVHFHEKVQNGEVGSQNSSKQFLIHGASAKNIIGKINKFHDYHVRKPRERRKRKSLRQHNTSSVSAKPYKPRALDYSKNFQRLAFSMCKIILMVVIDHSIWWRRYFYKKFLAWQKKKAPK